ncbi:MAG TPA: hypothetical protein VGM72_05555 [Micropepsaceae bacterium]
MTKHVHMSSHSRPPRAQGAEHSSSLSWFVLAALVFYAAMIWFGGEHPAWSPIAQFATNMMDRWDESVAPAVLAPLREKGLSVLHHGS